MDAIVQSLAESRRLVDACTGGTMSLIMSNLLIVNCTRGLRSISHYEAHSELIVAL